MNHAVRIGFLLSAIVLVGCNGTPEGQLPTAKTTVTITHKGSPVADAVVTFAQVAKPPAFGRTDASGKAQMTTYATHDGAILGSHMVTVQKQEFGTGKGKPRDEGSLDEGTYDPGASVGYTPPPVVKNLLPEKYTLPTTSGLKAEVVKGKTNEFTFDL